VTLDARARRAAHDFRRAVEDLDRSAPERRSFERFDRFRRIRQRNARVRVIVVGCALAIVAIFFEAHAIPRGERPAAPPPRDGRIVFVRFDPHSGEPVTFSMDPDGTDETQMFFSGFFSGHSEWPHWSPDGTRVTVYGCGGRSGAACIVNPDTGESRALPLMDPGGLEEDCGNAWSPDGRLLACGSYGVTDPRKTGLWTIRSSDGGGLKQLTSNPGGADEPGDFSPDGKRLVFVRADENDKTIGLFVIRVDGSGLQQITPPGMILDWFRGSWSPTGNQILFVARTDAHHRRAIWEVNADRSGLHQLPIPGCGGPVTDPKSTGCSYPGWSPDGTKIVFTRITGNGKRSNIAIVNADGSGLVQITHTGDADEADWGTHPTVAND
jgi:Tol biopolymer transport system component